MLKKLLLAVPAAAVLFFAGYQSGAQAAAAETNVYELRTYVTLPGRLDALNARFRNHTTKLFEKHGMKNIGYWIPQDERKANTLIYLLQHKSRAAADASWKAFQTDPAWVKARTASEADGKIVEKVERIWLDPVDYSALK